MKNIGKYLFLFVLSMVNTSIAGLVLYISPVLSYVGSVDQIPLIMEGLLSGALISSFAGFFIWLFAGSKQKILLSLSLAYSLILFAATMSIYFIDGPLPNSSVFIGSFASESFLTIFLGVFYTTVNSTSPKWHISTAILMFLFNLLVFIIIALVYMSLGQSDFPYILECLIVSSIIVSMPFLVSASRSSQ